MREFTGSEIKAIRHALGENGKAMSQTEFGRQFSKKFPVHFVTIARWETNVMRPNRHHRRRLEELWTITETKRRRPIPKPEKQREMLSEGIVLNLRYDK